jgi:hypothetical protein
LPGNILKAARQRAQERIMVDFSRPIVVTPPVVLNSSRKILEPWHTIQSAEQLLRIAQKIRDTKEPRDHRKIIK